MGRNTKEAIKKRVLKESTLCWYRECFMCSMSGLCDYCIA